MHERFLGGRRVKRTQAVGDRQILVVFRPARPGQRADSRLMSKRDYLAAVTYVTVPGSGGPREEASAGARMAPAVVALLALAAAGLFCLIGLLCR